MDMQRTIECMRGYLPPVRSFFLKQYCT